MAKKRNRRLTNGQRISLDLEVRAAALLSNAAGIDEAAISKAATCSPATAWRVAMLRRLSGAMTLELWLRGHLTMRQLARIVLDAPLLDPHSEDEQLALARHYPAAARALGPADEHDAK